jgi:hypothetical protein
MPRLTPLQMKVVALEVEGQLAGITRTAGQLRDRLLARYGVEVSKRMINKLRADPAFRQACDQLRNQTRVRLPLAGN